MFECALLIGAAIAAAVVSVVLYRRAPVRPQLGGQPLRDIGWSVILMFDAALLLASAVLFAVL